MSYGRVNIPPRRKPRIRAASPDDDDDDDNLIIPKLVPKLRVEAPKPRPSPPRHAPIPGSPPLAKRKRIVAKKKPKAPPKKRKRVVAKKKPKAKPRRRKPNVPRPRVMAKKVGVPVAKPVPKKAYRRPLPRKYAWARPHNPPAHGRNAAGSMARTRMRTYIDMLRTNGWTYDDIAQAHHRRFNKPASYYRWFQEYQY